MKAPAVTVLLGVLFGATLSFIGFSSWDETHRMFVFADLRMLLTFALAVTLLTIGFRLSSRGLAAGVTFPARPIHRGTLLGGALFGVGWAVSGACPSIAFVQLGEGQLGALVTVAGMLMGSWLYALLRERYLRWDTGSCLDE